MYLEKQLIQESALTDFSDFKFLLKNIYSIRDHKEFFKFFKGNKSRLEAISNRAFNAVDDIIFGDAAPAPPTTTTTPKSTTPRPKPASKSKPKIKSQPRPKISTKPKTKKEGEIFLLRLYKWLKSKFKLPKLSLETIKKMYEVSYEYMIRIMHILGILSASAMVSSVVGPALAGTIMVGGAIILVLVAVYNVTTVTKRSDESIEPIKYLESLKRVIKDLKNRIKTWNLGKYESKAAALSMLVFGVFVFLLKKYITLATISGITSSISSIITYLSGAGLTVIGASIYQMAMFYVVPFICVLIIFFIFSQIVDDISTEKFKG